MTPLVGLRARLGEAASLVGARGSLGDVPLPPPAQLGKLVVVTIPRLLISVRRCPIEGDLSPVMNGPDAHTLAPGCGRMHYQYGFANLPLVPCGGTLIGLDKTKSRMFCPTCDEKGLR